MPIHLIRQYYEIYIENNLGKDFLDQLPEIEKSIEKLEIIEESDS